MSLLLDALKRAEQEKLAKQGDKPANDAPANGAPAPAARREPANAPALELQPIAGSAAPAKPAAAAKNDAKPGVAAAQAVFQAKAPPPKAGGSRNTTMLWVIGAVVIVAALGIGGYVWWSLSALQPKITTLRTRPAPTPAPAGAANQPRVETLVPGAIAPATPPRDDSTTSLAAPQPATASTPAAPTAPGATSAITTLPSRARPPEVAAQLVREAPATPSLRLTPAEKPRVAPEIVAGYDALRAGDLVAARRSYAAALSADPANLDGHLGLATVEARLGNAPAAASHYRRALDAEPRNATALAGLAALADTSSPEALEAHLRADLARYPQNAGLHFALGNLYASRGRWEEAQAAFFEALRLEPASADTLYNVAVAMDHMGHPRIAADYYRRALEASRSQAAQFDPALVTRRLAELKP